MCKKCTTKNFWGPYIGETERRFCDRVQEHRGYITQKVDNEIGRHFNGPGHSVADLLPVAIEKIYGNERIRKNRKSYWIEQYDSVSFGANKKS